jgi:hypothetical protein
MERQLETADSKTSSGRTIMRRSAPLSEPPKSKLSTLVQTHLRENGFGHLFGSPSELTIAAAPLIFEISDMPFYARNVLFDYLLETFKEQSHA